MRPSRMIPFALLLPGCGETAPPPASAPPALSIPAPAPPAPESRGPVEAAAKVFLRQVGQGTASSRELTAEFKRVIAPPAFDRDKAQGYSDDRAESWLKALMPNAAAAAVNCPKATAEVGYAVATAAQGRTLLRLVKVGNDWLVDWCQNTAGEPRLPGSPSGTDADEAGAWFVAAAFVESVGQGQLASAESLLTKPAMAKLSPPLFEADAAPGFNRTKLPDELRRLVPAGTVVTHFQLEKVAGGYLGRGELKGGSTAKSLLVMLTRGTRPGEWKVNDLDVK